MKVIGEIMCKKRAHVEHRSSAKSKLGSREGCGGQGGEGGRKLSGGSGI